MVIVLRVKVSYPDANVFRSIFDVLGKIIDEAKLNFTEEGMRVRAMDPANVALIDIKFPRESFTEYEIEGEATVGLNLSIVLKLLKRAKRGDRLDIEADGERVKISIIGVIKREFELRNLEVITPEIPEASLELDIKLSLLVDPLRQALKDLELVGETVTLTYDGEEKVILSGKSETRYTMELTKESGALIDLEAKNKGEATYSVDYLLNVLSLVKVADTVRLEFSNQMPLRLEFDLPAGGSVTYLLAPSAV
jgi:proliferating cell nuclear antigen